MNKVECCLCPRRCRLLEGERGFCRVRTNIGGKLFSLVYGNPCSVHVDPVEKKPFFHVAPGSSAFSVATTGCNLRCRYCQNWQISQIQPEDARNIDLPPEKVVAQALAARCRSIAYTYTEPIVFYEYTRDTCALARDKGLLNLIITAGYIEQQPLKELCQVADAIKVDLKGITETFYRDMTGATLQPVLDAIVTIRKAGVWLEICNLIVPTWNDTDKDLLTLIRWIKDNCGKDTPVHFSRFWPTYQLTDLPPTPLGTVQRARAMAMAEGMPFVYTGNIPDDEGNNTFCPHDGALLIARQGYEITHQNLVDGKCPHCAAAIPGLWQ